MIRNIVVVVLGAIVLSFTSFHNRFPLLTENSGIYLNSGFGKGVSTGSAVYGFFLAHSSWGFSLWLVVFCQAFILSLVIYYYFRYFSYGVGVRLYYLAFVFSISFLTAASVTVSSIGAGVFSCISMLAIGLLLLAEKIPKRDVFIIASIASLSMGMSIVNLLATGLLILIFVAGLCTKLSVFKTSWRRIGLSMAMVAISWLLISAGHALKNGFTIYIGDISNSCSGWFSGRHIFSIPDYPGNVKQTETFTAVSKQFNWELREACLSKQYFYGLKFNLLSYVQLIVCVISVLIFIFMVFAAAIKKYYLLFSFFVAGILIFLITACFVNGEKGSPGWQMLWLLMLPLFVAVAGNERKSLNVNRSNS